MQNKIVDLWNKYYQYYLNHYSHGEIDKEYGLPQLRDKLFISILVLTLPIGLLVYVPSLIISIKTGQFVIAIYDTIAILVVFFIFFYKKQSIKTKKIIFSITIYILATILILYLGTMGPGIIVLFCISILITLYYSKKAGLISIGMNALIYFFLLMGISKIESTELVFFHEYTTKSWIGVGTNLIGFNTIMVLSVSFVIDQLQKSLLKEQKLQMRLKEESEFLLKAKEKAEESDRLKTSFLQNISHEIRTPMNGILGFAYLLKDPDLSDENKKAYIHIIQKSGDRMLNTINDLINISKIEAGQEKATMEKVDVNQAMYDTFEFFQPECKNKGLNIYFEERLKDEEKIVYSDSDKLSSILTNLVKNAVKFTEDGCVEIGCEKKGEYIEFFVKDTGIGIPENRQEAIFDRFVQADIDDRSVYEGSGLGLSITKSYVDMLGGRIWLRSSEGYGTHFYFTIPFKPYEEKVIDASPESGKAIDILKENKLKILVAEDDTTSYEYISIILEEVTDEILQAENGKKAVDLCHSHPDIDLILMDVKMPVMDGYTATKQIREFNDEVKIIAQTAYSLPNDKQKALQTGCNAFITKPTNKDELLSMIDELMLSRKC